MWPWRRTPTRAMPFELRNLSASTRDVSMGRRTNLDDIHWRTIMAPSVTLGRPSGRFHSRILRVDQGSSPLQVFIRHQTGGDQFDLPVPQEIGPLLGLAQRVEVRLRRQRQGGVEALPALGAVAVGEGLVQGDPAERLLDGLLGELGFQHQDLIGEQLDTGGAEELGKEPAVDGDGLSALKKGQLPAWGHVQQEEMGRVFAEIEARGERQVSDPEGIEDGDGEAGGAFLEAGPGPGNFDLPRKHGQDPGRFHGEGYGKRRATSSNWNGVEIARGGRSDALEVGYRSVYRFFRTYLRESFIHPLWSSTNKPVMFVENHKQASPL